jgi:hypothetical protein
MTTDVDMVFPPDFLSVAMKNAGPKKVLYCVPHFMKEGFSDWEHLEDHITEFHIGGAGHMGGCQVIPTRVFREMRGFDETYQYWGREDNDMNRRLVSIGFKEHWLNDQLYFFHQWHPIERYNTPDFMPLGQWAHMQNHFYRHLGEVKRNNADWGRVLRTKDRQVFKFLDVENFAVANDARINFIDLAPDAIASINTFPKAFWELASGEALLLKHYFFPNRSGWADALIATGNVIARALQSDIKFSYSPNLLYAFIIEFLSENSAVVADYYLGFPAFDGVAILVRS